MSEGGSKWVSEWVSEWTHIHTHTDLGHKEGIRLVHFAKSIKHLGEL